MHDRLVHAVFLGAVMVALLGGAIALSPAPTGTQMAQTISTDTSSTLTTSTTYPATTLTTYTTYPTTTLTTYTVPATDTNTTAVTVYEEPIVTEPVTQTIDTTRTLEPTSTIVPSTEVLMTEIKTPLCPLRFEPSRTVVDFTHGGTVGYADLVLLANGTKDQSVRSVTATLAPGIYDIQLAGFDAHSSTATTEYREVWGVELIDSAGAVLRSDSSRDIRDAETLVVETVNTAMAVKQGIVRIVARHRAYPDEVPQSVAPLCVAFDRVGDIPPALSTAVSPVIATTSVVSADENTLTATANPRCPLPPRVGRTIVDFTKQGSVPLVDLVVRSDGTKVSAIKGPLPVVLPRGNYTVRLVSYGGKLDGTTYPGQTLRAVIYGTDGSVITTTPPSRDIPDWSTDFSSLVAEKLSIPMPGARVGAVHGEYPSTSAGPVAVLCVAFDAVETDTVASVPPPTSFTSGTKEPAPEPADLEQPMLNDTPLADALPDERPTAVPMSIGIESALRTVPVPEESFVRAREAFVARTDAPIFPMLARAQTAEREEIVAQLLTHEMLASTSASTTPMRALVSLVRMSDESGLASIEGDEGADRATPLLKRAGLISLRDTDGDGITDYDEEYIYATDPANPFTGRSVLTDGERVLLGLDPLASSTEVVVTESPRQAGYATELLSVASVALVASSSIEGATVGSGLRVTGFAPPLSFVTLYMYSTPIMVTVRADSAGRYEYTFDHTLDDGSHELYVASVNNAGKILAKSEPLPFVKTAEAISFTPPSVNADPVTQGTHTSIAFTLLLLLLAAVGSIIAIGVWKTHQGGVASEGTSPEHHA